MKRSGLRVPVGISMLAGLFAAAGWIDYRATSRDLRALRQSEAGTLYETIAAAARVQHAAAQAAEAGLGQRLLDQARLLAATDRRMPLDSASVAAMVPDAGPFRVIVFDAEGRREFAEGEAPQGQGGGQGRGQGQGRGRGQGQGLGPGLGTGRGQGHGFGPPPGASRVAQRLLSGEARELVSDSHASRTGGERIAAGVRRANGGAIVINAANRLASELDSIYSLDVLISQIAEATPALAYIILQEKDSRVARGPLAAAAPEAPIAEAGSATSQVANVPVFERRGTVALDDTRETLLRIGMRLDDVQRAERRALARVGGGLGALAAVAILAVAFGGLQQRYGLLSERHAHAQEALRRRDRLTAMGEMASTVAHEIRNPLNAIAMSAQRLAREYPAGTADEAPELVDVIQREASRIDARVQQFLEFARPRPINPRDVALPAALAEVAASAGPLAGARGVRIDVRPGSPLTVSADVEQVREAVDNLVRNAIEATPAGGVITLSAERRGRNVVIEVCDTGAGIPADVLPRIFDLYFTTKREGTGVGLAVVQQIASAHGGSVSIESEPGKGTRIALELPQHGASRV